MFIAHYTTLASVQSWLGYIHVVPYVFPTFIVKGKFKQFMLPHLYFSNSLSNKSNCIAFIP